MMIKKSSPVNQRVEVGTTLLKCRICGNLVVGDSIKTAGSVCADCRLSLVKKSTKEPESDAGIEGR